MSDNWHPIAELHPILYDCCAAEESKYAICEPFRDGPYVIALDGRIAVRQRCDADMPPTPVNVPHTDAVFEELDWSSIPLHALPPVRINPRRGTCPDCRGKERVTCNMGHEHFCDTCQGSGVVLLDEGPVPIGPAWLAIRYARILWAHGVRALRVRSDKTNRPMQFTIGPTIDGVVMPSRDPAELAP